MKYEKTIERIRKGTFSRAELVKLRSNAEEKARAGDMEAQHVISEIGNAAPIDDFIVFMGFCPGADFDNRLDLEWRAQNVCTFVFLDSPKQLERFNNIWAGDLIILKKREKFGKTMKLYGHGRVTGAKYDADGNRYLLMDWGDQDDVVEVPLMGCNATVDVRSVEQVEAEMPEKFYDWLDESRRAQ